MLKVTNLKRSYRLSKGTVEQALKGIDFELNAGEFVAIYGPSGCGKSTLLNALGGLDNGYQGEIFFQDKNLRIQSKSQLAEYRRDNVGFIFQNFNLIPHLTVLENIVVAADLNVSEGAKKKAIAQKALETVGLGTYSDKRPNQLSGGQRQRVAIARALVNNPDVIIADEPTGALDTKTALDILQMLQDLANSGKLVIVVTHNQEVADFGTRIIKMRDGIVESDTFKSDFEGRKRQEQQQKRRARIGIFKTFRMAFKNFMQRKGRNFLVSLGTSIGIIGIILALSLGNGITKEVGDILEKTSDSREVFVTGRDPITGNQDLSGMESQQFAKAQQEIGADKIIHKTPQYVVPLATFEIDGKKGEKAFNLINSGDVAYKSDITVRDMVQYGDLQTSNDEDGIWLTQKIIDDIEGKESVDYQSYIGKTTTVTAVVKVKNTSKKVSYTTKIKGVFGKPNAAITRFPVLTEKSMGQFLEVNQLKNELLPARYSLILRDAKEAERVTEKFRENKEFSVMSAQSAIKMFNQIVSIIQAILSFVAALSVIVAMVMIGIVLYISVIQRTREIGTLKAIGYKSGSILQIFLFEAVFIAIIANVVAIIVSSGLAVLLNAVIESVAGVSQAILISPLMLVVILVFSALAAMISGLYPAIQASRQDPASALRYE